MLIIMTVRENNTKSPYQVPDIQVMEVKTEGMVCLSNEVNRNSYTDVDEI